MRRITTVLCTSLLAALALIPASAQASRSSSFDAYLAPVGVCADDSALAAPAAQERASVACLVNWARARRSLPPLRTSAQLEAAAQLKLADDSRCNEFSHTACGSPFLSVFRRSGYLNG